MPWSRRGTLGCEIRGSSHFVAHIASGRDVLPPIMVRDPLFAPGVTSMGRILIAILFVSPQKSTLFGENVEEEDEEGVDLYRGSYEKSTAFHKLYVNASTG